MTSLLAAGALAVHLASQAADQAAPSPFSGIWMMVIIIVIFWFLVIAPQRKEMKEKEKMREGVKKGDNVVTIGGAHGQVVSADKETVTVRLAEKVHIVFERNAIARVLAGEHGGETKK